MKKFFIFVAAMVSAVCAFAQFEPGTLSFQPKAGLNIAYFSNADGADPRFMYAAGAEVEYQFTKKVACFTPSKERNTMYKTPAMCTPIIIS